MNNECYAQIYMNNEYYTYFGMPTCRQAAMQIAEDWRQQQSSALTKRQQQRSTISLLSPVSRIASMLQRSGIKTANSIHCIVACLQVGVPKWA